MSPDLNRASAAHLREVCDGASMKPANDASLTDLFKQFREGHPAFRDLGPRSDDIVRVLRALASILDTLNNAARSILHYVDEKVHRHACHNGPAAGVRCRSI